MTSDEFAKESESSILREALAALEHDQWESWSKHVAKELADIKVAIHKKDRAGAQKVIDRILNRWSASWGPYAALSETDRTATQVGKTICKPR